MIEQNTSQNGKLKYPEFNYVDYAIGGVEKRNNIVEFCKTKDANRSVAYRTWHRFGVDYKSHVKNTGSVTNYEGASFSDYLPFDFDNSDLEISKQMALEFVEYLKTMFDVTPESLLYFFSGNKGFHIYIPIELFGEIKPGINLHAILKAAAFLLWSPEKMDTSIYDQNRLFRIPNTKHQTSGLYKVQLRPNEFYNFTVEEIKTLAKQPRKLFRPELPAPNAQLVQLFHEAKQGLTKMPKTTGTATATKGIREGDRNRNLTSLAGAMRRQGASYEEILEALKLRNEARCNPPLTEKEVEYIAKSVSRYPVENNNSNGQYSPNSSNLEIETVQLSSVKAQDVQYLWYPRIPQGKVTLVEGDPGVGKSWLTMAIATGVSLGKGIPEREETEPGNVLVLSAEDGLADTIKPRLQSFGADCERIFAPIKLFTLDATGLSLLENLTVKYTPKLVILDPLVAYLGSRVDINRANETREIMAGLAVIAEKANCAIVAVRHLTKSTKTRSIYRGMGSIDLTAACRSVLLVGHDANNPEIRAVVHIKSNLAPKGSPIGYRIEAGKFYWTDTTITAEDILDSEESDITPIDEAKDFLMQMLDDGLVLSTDVFKQAGENHISERTLRRAKKQLKIKSVKNDNNWYMEYPKNAI